MSLGTALLDRALGAARHPELSDVVVPTLLIRLALMVYAPLAVLFMHVNPPPEGWLHIWNRWDGPHYLEIAARGYDPNGDTALVAFFPLYPGLIRIASNVLPPLQAAMVISLVATLLAGIGLYRLVLPDAGRDAARRAVLLLNIFPTAFALVAPYSEPVFLALTIWSFLLARRDDWVGASVMGMLAAIARIQGALLLPVLAVEYLLTRRRLGRDLLWVALVPVGSLVYLAVNLVAYGDPFFFLGVQREHFYHHLELPWVVIGDLVRDVATHGPDEGWATVYVAPLVALAFLALVAGWSAWAALARRLRASYAAYAIVSWGLLASMTWPISAPRYTLAVFPVFIVLATLTENRIVRFVTVAVSLFLLLVFTAVFARGGWAF